MNLLDKDKVKQVFEALCNKVVEGLQGVQLDSMQQELLRDALVFMGQRGLSPDRGYHNLQHFLDVDPWHDVILKYDHDFRRPQLYTAAQPQNKAGEAIKAGATLNQLLSNCAERWARQEAFGLTGEALEASRPVIGGQGGRDLSDEMMTADFVFHLYRALGVSKEATIQAATNSYATNFFPIAAPNKLDNIVAFVALLDTAMGGEALASEVNDRIIAQALQVKETDIEGYWKDNAPAKPSIASDIGERAFTPLELDAMFFGFNTDGHITPSAGSIGIGAEAFRNRYPHRLDALVQAEAQGKSFLHIATPRELVETVVGMGWFNDFNAQAGSVFLDKNPQGNTEAQIKSAVCGQVWLAMAGLASHLEAAAGGGAGFADMTQQEPTLRYIQSQLLRVMTEKLTPADKETLKAEDFIYQEHPTSIKEAQANLISERVGHIRQIFSQNTKPKPDAVLDVLHGRVNGLLQDLAQRQIPGAAFLAELHTNQPALFGQLVDDGLNRFYLPPESKDAMSSRRAETYIPAVVQVTADMHLADIAKQAVEALGLAGGQRR